LTKKIQKSRRLEQNNKMVQPFNDEADIITEKENNYLKKFDISYKSYIEVPKDLPKFTRPSETKYNYKDLELDYKGFKAEWAYKNMKKVN